LKFFISFHRIPYWCARSSKWGDRLPVVIKEEEKGEEEEEKSEQN